MRCERVNQAITLVIYMLSALSSADAVVSGFGRDRLVWLHTVFPG